MTLGTPAPPSPLPPRFGFSERLVGVVGIGGRFDLGVGGAERGACR